MFVSDVDRVAQITVDALFDVDSSAPPIRQIFDGLLFSELWALVMDQFGYEMHPVPYENWLERLQSAIATQRETHELFPFKYSLEIDCVSYHSRHLPQSRSKPAKAAIVFNILQLIDAGYLPPPPVPRALGCFSKA